MATHFQIACQWDRDSLYLHLLGDFDEASAYELIDVLGEKCHDASSVFIAAKGVRNLDASGCDTFKKRVQTLKDYCYRLVFTDQNAIRLKPERSMSRLMKRVSTLILAGGRGERFFPLTSMSPSRPGFRSAVTWNRIEGGTPSRLLAS